MRGLRLGCLAFVLFVSASLIGLQVYVWRRESELERTGWTPRKVERVLAASSPHGSPRTRVEAWLETQPFKLSLLDPSEAIGMTREAGLEPRDLADSAILAEVPDPHVDVWGSESSISVIFYFDKKDRLVKRDVRVWIMSL